MIDNSDILRLASEANAAAIAYRDAICKRLTGIIAGRRLIQAVDALTAAIADQAAAGREAQDSGAPTMLRVTDFPRAYRFRIVQAYPAISGVDNVHEATYAEIDDGFALCLKNQSLRRTHEMFRVAYEGQPKT